MGFLELKKHILKHEHTHTHTQQWISRTIFWKVKDKTNYSTNEGDKEHSKYQNDR